MTTFKTNNEFLEKIESNTYNNAVNVIDGILNNYIFYMHSSDINANSFTNKIRGTPENAYFSELTWPTNGSENLQLTSTSDNDNQSSITIKGYDNNLVPVSQTIAFPLINDMTFPYTLPGSYWRVTNILFEKDNNVPNEGIIYISKATSTVNSSGKPTSESDVRNVILSDQKTSGVHQIFIPPEANSTLIFDKIVINFASHNRCRNFFKIEYKPSNSDIWKEVDRFFYFNRTGESSYVMEQPLNPLYLNNDVSNSHLGYDVRILSTKTSSSFLYDSVHLFVKSVDISVYNNGS